MATASEPGAFNEYAGRYDAWYESPKGKVLLAIELACLRPLLASFPRPYLEVGVGTGRFAEALGIELGLDPSRQALEKAYRRSVQCVVGVGEALPFQDHCFGGVLVAFTLCFVRDPLQVVREIRRVLMPRGGIVLGMLLRGTPWADLYARQGKQGHPLYKRAHFYSKEEVESLLRKSGFRVTGYRATLFQRPGLETYKEEQPIEGYVAGAGFIGIAASRAE
ncbi:MAG: class I SAM-dependent methyltransferase [Chloroflexota bacterium]